jgi:hypothetical protein
MTTRRYGNSPKHRGASIRPSPSAPPAYPLNGATRSLSVLKRETVNAEP